MFLCYLVSLPVLLGFLFACLFISFFSGENLSCSGPFPLLLDPFCFFSFAQFSFVFDCLICRFDCLFSCLFASLFVCLFVLVCVCVCVFLCFFVCLFVLFLACLFCLLVSFLLRLFVSCPQETCFVF